MTCNVTLMTSVVLEFEAQFEYELDVTATDSQGHAVVKLITIIVMDTNDPPTVSLTLVCRIFLVLNVYFVLCSVFILMETLLSQTLFPQWGTADAEIKTPPPFVGGSLGLSELPFFV